MNTGILENLLNDNDVIMIDTCFAMRDEFPSFIDSIEIELMARKQRITVKSVVLAELYRHMGSADAKLRSKATRAIETICMRRNIFDIDEERIDADAIIKAFADVEFIADFTRNRIKYRMALLTNDYKLGKDINELNNLESCYGKRIEVFLLNRDGALEECKYEDTQVAEVESSKQEVQVHEEEKHTCNWSVIMLSSAVSFAVGVLIDKYGKKVVNSVVKAIA